MKPRVVVQMDITDEEAVRQLEGGKSVEVLGTEHKIRIVASTNNVDTSKWMFCLYAYTDGDLGTFIREYSQAEIAVKRAIEASCVRS